MAFSSGNKQGPISDINVTPLVDVMLVLLVIFMITAPLMLNAIQLKLPKTKEVNRVNLTTRQVVLSVTRAEDYYIGKDKVLFKEIIPVVLSQFQENKTTTLFLRADFGIRYGRVAKLMSYLKKSGIENIALVTETEK